MAIKKIIPDASEVQTALQPYMQEAMPVVTVDDPESYADAAELLRGVKTRSKELTALRKTMTEPLDEARKAIMRMFEPALARYAGRETALKNAISAYNARIEAERRLIEARLRDEQRALEAKAKAKAEVLEASGKHAQAEAVLDAVPSVPVVIANTPKVSGLSYRTTWKAEIVDFEAFVIECLSSGRLDLLEANMTELNAFARTTHGTASFPGVHFSEVGNIAVRT